MPLFRVAIIGDNSVGKTTFARYLAFGKFEECERSLATEKYYCEHRFTPFNIVSFELTVFAVGKEAHLDTFDAIILCTTTDCRYFDKIILPSVYTLVLLM